MEVNKIYNENCLDTLRRMPDGFVDCVITSPPYFGLRSYKSNPQIWGGDKDCSHKWGQESQSAIQLQAGNPEFQRKWREKATDTTASSGAFCTVCKAWCGELGLEPTFQLFVAHLIDIFREVRRVLKSSGSVWVNLGDSYSGSNGNGNKEQSNKGLAAGKFIPYQNVTNKTGIKPKSLMNIPARFAIAMTDELRFIQRNEIIWHKPACMPSSAKDRFTVDFEKIFFFTKLEKYYFDQRFEPVAQSTIGRGVVDFGGAKGRDYTPEQGDPNFRNGSEQWGRTFNYEKSCANGRNMRTTWSVNFEPQSDEHFASYPTKLIETPILAGSPPDGIVYDPFSGTATTALVAHNLGRRWIGSELNPEYVEIANKRLAPYLAQVKLF